MSKSLWDKYKKEDKQEQTNSSGKANTTTAGTPTTTTTTATAPAANSIISPYAAQRDKLYSEYMGRKPFSYDYTNDPVYKAYEQSYTNKGKLAMEDTIAQSAALTGGYGNTYGHVAGQQVYDDYMQGLSDIIPDLYNDAYSKYKAEGDTLYNQYSLAANRADADQERAAAELAAILAAGGTPSDELIARSGYSPEYIKAMRSYYNQGTSGGTGSGSSSASGSTINDEIRQLMGLASDSVQSTVKGGIDYLQGKGSNNQSLSTAEQYDLLKGGVQTGTDLISYISSADAQKAAWEDCQNGLITLAEYYSIVGNATRGGHKRVQEVQ